MASMDTSAHNANAAIEVVDEFEDDSSVDSEHDPNAYGAGDLHMMNAEQLLPATPMPTTPGGRSIARFTGRKPSRAWAFFQKGEYSKTSHRFVATCKYCGHKFDGRLPRLKMHIEKCPNINPEDKQMLLENSSDEEDKDPMHKMGSSPAFSNKPVKTWHFFTKGEYSKTAHRYTAFCKYCSAKLDGRTVKLKQHIRACANISEEDKAAFAAQDSDQEKELKSPKTSGMSATTPGNSFNQVASGLKRKRKSTSDVDDMVVLPSNFSDSPTLKSTVDNSILLSYITNGIPLSQINNLFVRKAHCSLNFHYSWLSEDYVIHKLLPDSFQLTQKRMIDMIGGAQSITASLYAIGDYHFHTLFSSNIEIDEKIFFNANTFALHDGVITGELIAELWKRDLQNTQKLTKVTAIVSDNISYMKTARQRIVQEASYQHIVNLPCFMHLFSYLYSMIIGYPWSQGTIIRTLDIITYFTLHTEAYAILYQLVQQHRPKTSSPLSKLLFQYPQLQRLTSIYEMLFSVMDVFLPAVTMATSPATDALDASRSTILREFLTQVQVLRGKLPTEPVSGLGSNVTIGATSILGSSIVPSLAGVTTSTSSAASNGIITMAYFDKIMALLSPTSSYWEDAHALLTVTSPLYEIMNSVEMVTQPTASLATNHLFLSDMAFAWIKLSLYYTNFPKALPVDIQQYILHKYNTFTMDLPWDMMMLSMVLDPRFIDYLSEGYDLSTNIVTVSSWMKNYAIPFAENRQLIYQLIVYYQQARQKSLVANNNSNIVIPTGYAPNTAAPSGYPNPLPDHNLLATGYGHQQQPPSLHMPPTATSSSSSSSSAAMATSSLANAGVQEVKTYWEKISTRENDRLLHLVKLLFSIVPYMTTSVRTMTVDRKIRNPVNDQISISNTFHHLHALAIHYADYSFPPIQGVSAPMPSAVTGTGMIPTMMNSSHIGLAGPTLSATTTAMTSAMDVLASGVGVGMSDSEDDELPAATNAVRHIIPTATTASSSSSAAPSSSSFSTLNERYQFIHEMEVFGGGYYTANGEFRHKSYLPNSRKVLEAIEVAFAQVNLPVYHVSVDDSNNNATGTALPDHHTGSAGGNGGVWHPLKGMLNSVNTDWLDRQHAVLHIHGVDYDYARKMIDTRILANGYGQQQPSSPRKPGAVANTQPTRSLLNPKFDYDFDTLLSRVYA